MTINSFGVRLKVWDLFGNEIWPKRSDLSLGGARLDNVANQSAASIWATKHRHSISVNLRSLVIKRFRCSFVYLHMEWFQLLLVSPSVFPWIENRKSFGSLCITERVELVFNWNTAWSVVTWLTTSTADDVEQRFQITALFSCNQHSFQFVYFSLSCYYSFDNCKKHSH